MRRGQIWIFSGQYSVEMLGKYGPEKPGIWTIFSVCSVIKPITKYTGKNTLNDGKDQKKALQREQTPTSGNLLTSLS